MLDIHNLNEASRILMSYTDFTSFARLHTDTKTNDCKIMEAAWSEKGDFLVFKIKADRFLRNMVRAIVGTMVDLGSGKISIKDYEQIIESRDRSKAGQSAPPQGLFLSHVEYPAEKFETSPGIPFKSFISL
jgi:tRNA pseudouridine38-40 synthase